MVVQPPPSEYYLSFAQSLWNVGIFWLQRRPLVVCAKTAEPDVGPAVVLGASVCNKAFGEVERRETNQEFSFQSIYIQKKGRVQFEKNN